MERRLTKRGEMDNLPQLENFGKMIEKSSIQTLDDGIMTKDIVGLVDSDKKTVSVTSIEFIKAIRERLTKLLA